MTAAFLIAFLLFACYAALLVYYRLAWTSIPVFTVPADYKPVTKLSVIIPARNEAANIGACLDALTTNDYPAGLREIIVVDDHSTDDTAAIVQQYADRNVRLITLQEYVSDPINSYKKKAIDIAVQQASGELIVTTDADCIVPRNWLRNIAAFYQINGAVFIAAPVSIDPAKNFIQLFQALDFMTLQGITGAGVSKKVHTMCNGANLAYKRSAFFEVNGFEGINSIASGDDMLLMHKIYRRYPQQVLFLKSKEAIVRTAPVTSLAAFFNQRIRWASKADKYDDKRMFPVLLLVYLLNVALLLLPVAAVCSNATISIIHYQLSIINCWLLLLLLKTVAELLFLFPVAGFFGKRHLLIAFPLLQPFHIIYTVVAGFLGKFGSYTWKGRKVK